jgi:hypothetical protein
MSNIEGKIYQCCCKEKNPQNVRQPNKHFVGFKHTSTRWTLLFCCMLSMILSWNSQKCFATTNGKMNKISIDRTYYLSLRKVPTTIIKEETS